MQRLLSIILMLAMMLTLGVTAFASDTRTWQDGFGFHCNTANGNGATSVEYIGDDLAVQNSIAGIKKQPAGSMVVPKGDQKDIFGTRTFPIDLERVGDTTLWNLLTSDIECSTCGRTDWVTYSNRNGVINGKNIQAHHPPLPLEVDDDPPSEISAEVYFVKQKYGGLLEVASGEFEFELFKIDATEAENKIGTFSTGDNGVVRATVEEPGSYVFREVLAVDHAFDPGASIGEKWDYRLVWKAIYPDGKDGLYFDIDAEGIVTWNIESLDNPIVNNVYHCKHALQWSIRYERFLTFECAPGNHEYVINTNNPATCINGHTIQFKCSKTDDPEYRSNVFSITIAPPLGHDLIITHTLAGCTTDEKYGFNCRNCGLAESHISRPDLLAFVPGFDFDSYDPEVGLAKAYGHDFDFVNGNRRNGTVSPDGIYSASLWCRHNGTEEGLERCSVSGVGGWADNVVLGQLACGDEYIINTQNGTRATWYCGICNDCIPPIIPEVCNVCEPEECECPEDSEE